MPSRSNRYAAPGAQENEYVESFERLKRKNTIKRIRRRIFYALLMILLAGVFLVIAVAIFFKVGTITVEGNTFYDDQELIDASGVEYGTNLYLVDTAAVADSIRTNFPFIRSVAVRRSVPTTLVLDVKCDNAAFYTEISGEFFVLSPKLRVLERGTDAAALAAKYPGLKKLATSQARRAVVGGQMSFYDDNYADKLIDFLASVSGSSVFDGITSVDAADKFNLCAVYDHRLKVNLGSDTDMEVKLMFLEGIIADLGDSSGTVDVKDAEMGYVILTAGVVYD